MVPLLTDRLQKDMEGKALSAEDTYMIHYHCNGILRVIFLWLKAGIPESPEELAGIVLSVINGNHPAYELPFFQEAEQDCAQHEN